MKILVAGDGTRAFAVARKIEECGNEPIFLPSVTPAGFFRTLPCNPADSSSIANAAESEEIPLAVFTDEKAMISDLSERLVAHGVRAFAPPQRTAIALSDGLFVRKLAEKAGVPIPPYREFTSAKEAEGYIGNRTRRDTIVVSRYSPDKRTTADNERAAITAAKRVLRSEKSVIVEDRVFGHRMGISVITDGKTVVFPPATSATREEKNGKNTTFGAVAPNPFYTERVREETEKTVVYPFLGALKKEGFEVRGWLYFDITLTGYGAVLTGIYLFPPETEAETLLALSESDFAGIAADAACGTLSAADVKFSSDYALSLGIDDPDEDEKRRVIEKRAYVYLNFGRVVGSEDGIEPKGGRIATVTVRVKTFNSAYNGAVDVATLSGIGGSFRRDVGSDAYGEICRKEEVNREKAEKLHAIEKNRADNESANLVAFDYSDPAYRERIAKALRRITGRDPEND